MRAGIYARYSSDSQSPQSIEDQVSLCRQEAKRRGWTVAAIWQDAALSGQLGEDRRPGYQEMMEAAKRKAFDVLIVDDASRLSRDSIDAQITLKVLEFLGVGFVARSDGIDTVLNAKSSRLVYGIKSAINEEFLRDLAEKTHRGLEGRARKGYSTGGLPYGYRSEPVHDDRGQIVGYRKTVYEPEAEVVRRIFRLSAGEEGTRPLSAREIAQVLNEERIPPPGARWRGRTLRQCATWSYTAIIGHRKLRKGILNNPTYIGQSIWNRSQWMRHPITKKFTYRVRPKDDWVVLEAPALRIVPQALWDKAQARLAALRSADAPPLVSPRFRRYLLSGFVKCGVCGGNYVISTAFSYRCGTFRNRGSVACSNHLAISRRRLERAVIAALRDHLYTEENVKSLVDRVREALRERARQHAAKQQQEDRARALRQVEREIDHIKQAIRFGKATTTLLEMLEGIERRRAALVAQEDPADDIAERLARTLERLPKLVRQHLADLETLLAANQVDRGKAILDALKTQVSLHPCGDHLEAEITGKAEGVLLLAASKSRRGFNSEAFRWLGEEDSNPR